MTPLSSTSLKNVLAGALKEAAEIIKSPGYILAALSPFLLLTLGAVFVLFIAGKQTPRNVALEVSPPQYAETVVEVLEKSIGPKADKTRLKGPDAAQWIPVSFDEAQGKVDLHVAIDIEANTISYVAGSPPGYMTDLITIAVLNAQLKANGQSGFTPSVASGFEAPALSLSANLIRLLTILLSTAAGGIAAASTHALATAYLAHENNHASNLNDPGEDLLAKILGIGSAYAALILPWALIGAGLLGVFALSGDAALSDAARSVAFSALDPMRLFLFAFCTACGYALYASLVLTLARKSKTSASARTLTGPLTVVALAPAPLALAFAPNIDGGMFQALTWIPLTSPASIQLGFGVMNDWDLLIRAAFLGFAVLIVLMWALAQARRQRRTSA